MWLHQIRAELEHGLKPWKRTTVIVCLDLSNLQDEMFCEINYYMSSLEEKTTYRGSVPFVCTSLK